MLQVVAHESCDGKCCDEVLTEVARIPVPDTATFEEELQITSPRGGPIANPCAANSDD
jgi:hypothetical protein